LGKATDGNIIGLCFLVTFV